MPIIEVKLYEKGVTEESVPKIIEALTRALAESSGASPSHIHVIVESIGNWGVGGRTVGRPA